MGKKSTGAMHTPPRPAARFCEPGDIADQTSDTTAIGSTIPPTLLFPARMPVRRGGDESLVPSADGKAGARKILTLKKLDLVNLYVVR